MMIKKSWFNNEFGYWSVSYKTAFMHVICVKSKRVSSLFKETLHQDTQGGPITVKIDNHPPKNSQLNTNVQAVVSFESPARLEDTK